MNPCSQHRIQCAEKPRELLAQIGIALAVPEGLNGVLLVLRAEVADDQLLCPIGGIQHQCPAHVLGNRHFLDHGEHFLPRLRFLDAAHIHVRCAALGVDEERLGEFGGKTGLSDAFSSVDDHLLSAVNFPFRNVQHDLFPPYLIRRLRPLGSKRAPGTSPPPLNAS